MAGNNSGSRVGFGRSDMSLGMAGPNSVGHMRGMVGVPMMGPMRPAVDPLMMMDGMQPMPFTMGPGRGQGSRGSSSGRGGYRGAGSVRGGGVGGFKRQRFDGPGNDESRSFSKRGNYGPHPEIYKSISEAVTPQMVLHLWADQGQIWTEQYLAHGLFTFAKLVEETCPDDVHQVRCCPLDVFGCNQCNVGAPLGDLIDKLVQGRTCISVQMRSLPDCISMVDAAKTFIMSMRPTECSKVARAMGKLDLQDEDLCMGLVQAMRSSLQESPPIAVAGIMAGLGQVAYRCANFLRCLF